MWVAWASHLQPVSEVGAVLWDEAFNLGGLCYYTVSELK